MNKIFIYLDILYTGLRDLIVKYDILLVVLLSICVGIYSVYLTIFSSFPFISIILSYILYVLLVALFYSIFSNKDEDIIGILSLNLFLLISVIWLVGSLSLLKIYTSNQPTKVKNVIWESNSTKYILDPKGDYIVMDKVNIKQYKLPQEEFYNFRELNCQHIEILNYIEVYKDISEDYNNSTATKYMCLDKKGDI